jgi:hypothetical protein
MNYADDYITDPTLFENQFRPDTQPDHYMQERLMDQDFAKWMKDEISKLDWDQSTLTGATYYIDYARSKAVALSNFNPLEAYREVLTFQIDFELDMLNWNRADTSSPEFGSFMKRLFAFMNAKISRTTGPDRERIQQNPGITVNEHRVRQDVHQNYPQEQRGMFGFKRKQKTQYEE